MSNNIDFRTHLSAAMVENALFLMDRGGLTLDMAAHRLGVTAEALEKAIDRSRKADNGHRG